ncbi:AAA domain-containing protein, partial [Halococcus thailandensis]|uniref:AAA domain-containing protein n=1 Tax=Halococcus thailandensis TaxID=335952 RepID=UPI001F4C53F8
GKVHCKRYSPASYSSIYRPITPPSSDSMEPNYLLEQGLDPHDIGIATPYRAQVRALNEALADVGIDAETREKIYYDTISGFQGSERTAMICSFVRSNRDGNVGFLESHDGPNRLNVGLSRAKRHLTVIGDWSTLINHPLYEQLHDLLTKQTKPIAREGTQIVDRHQ